MGINGQQAGNVTDFRRLCRHLFRCRWWRRRWRKVNDFFFLLLLTFEPRLRCRVGVAGPAL
jgi:hypothetical protein